MKHSIVRQLLYLASRNLYGRSYFYIWFKAIKLMYRYWTVRGTGKRIKVTCHKCETEYMSQAETVYYYDSTKCGACYL